MTSRICSRFWLVIIAAAVGLGRGQAAEKLSYDDFRYKLASRGVVVKHRGFKLTTIDGKIHSSRRLALETDHVRVFFRKNRFVDIPANQIAQVEISEGGRFFHYILWGLELPFRIPEIICGGSMGRGSAKCVVAFSAILAPVTLMAVVPASVYTLYVAPVFLACDGIAYLIPPKSYEIVSTSNQPQKY